MFKCTRGESVLLSLSIHSEKIKGMLLAAHSFDSANSLFKALAMAHGR